MTTYTPPALKTRPTALGKLQPQILLGVYGENGVGKSTLLGTFPKPLIINGENGLTSLLFTDHEDVEQWKPGGFRDLEALVYWLQAQNLDRYDTLAIDGIDVLADNLLLEMIAEHAKVMDADKQRPLLQANKAELVEYLGLRNQVMTLLAYLVGTGKHVVVTSSLRESGEPPNQRRGFDLPRATSKVVTKAMDIIGELTTLPDKDGNLHRILLTETVPARDAKSRIPALLPRVVNPTFDKLWAPYAAKINNTDTNNKEQTT